MRSILIAIEGDVKVQLSSTSVEHFWKEHAKIARKLTDREVDTGLAAAATGATIGLGASYTGREPKKIGAGTGEILIYYTDPSRGGGHKAQALALQEALEARGEKVQAVNFDTAYGDPKRHAQLNKSFNEALQGKRSASRNMVTAHIPFYMHLDDKKLKADMKGKRVVLAHAGLESWVNRLGKPAFILHSDQAAFKHPFVDRAAKGIGRANIHIAAETAAADLLNMHYTMPKRLKTIHGLPIKAPVPSSGASPFRNPGKVNITVSGGALGLNTPQMAERILNDSKIAKGTVIHAVAGRGQNLAALEALEATTKGKSVQVRAYGFAPLRDMMDAADVNVLRPHGTSITEARAAKKPFLLFLPHEKGRRMDWRNIKAVESLYTTPLSVSEHTVGKRVTEVLSNYRLELSRAQTLGVAPTGGSKGAARIIAKTPYFTAFPRTGRWLGAGRLGLGGLAAGAVGALAYRHAANRGLVLQRSKSNPQVQRWQRVVK